MVREDLGRLLGSLAHLRTGRVREGFCSRLWIGLCINKLRWLYEILQSIIAGSPSSSMLPSKIRSKQLVSTAKTGIPPDNQINRLRQL